MKVLTGAKDANVNWVDIRKIFEKSYQLDTLNEGTTILIRKKNITVRIPE